MYVGSPIGNILTDITLDDIQEYLSINDGKRKKFLVVADSLWKVIKAIGTKVGKDIPKPDFHNEESVKNFLNEMEIRNKLIDQMPDNVIPMDFHLYDGSFILIDSNFCRGGTGIYCQYFH